MSEYIKREELIDNIVRIDDLRRLNTKTIGEAIDKTTSIDIVHCKDCKHRPIIKDKQESAQGFNLDYPRCKEGWYDYECPCLCDDGFYNFYPADDWFCANGERKDETD